MVLEYTLSPITSYIYNFIFPLGVTFWNYFLTFIIVNILLIESTATLNDIKRKLVRSLLELSEA